MKKALELGRRGTNLTFSNPRVGCVIVKDGCIIGRGYHKKFGGHHAEINAMKNSPRNLKNSTMFVTLEPCTHKGKTGPCAKQIVEQGISRVVIGMKDPRPEVDGINYLRKNNVRVKVGVLKQETFNLIKDYVKLVKYKKPYVILKSAVSWDGKIATRTGESRWVSSKSSRNFTMKMRGNIGAIIAGRGTVNTDNPSLTYRLNKPRAKNPLRVIIDGKLNIKENLKVIKKGTLIVTSSESSSKKKRRLEKKGCQVVQITSVVNEKLPPEKILKLLGKKKVKRCLIEGGGTTAANFIEAKEVDRIIFIYGSKIIGGKDAPTAVDGVGVEKMRKAPKIKNVKRFNLGEDLVMQGDLI